MKRIRAEDGTANIIGKNLRRERLKLGFSQERLAVKLQLEGLDVNRRAIQGIEARTRFVTDIELIVICKVLKVTFEELCK